MFVSFTNPQPRSLSYAVLSFFVVAGNWSQAFTALALFNALRFPLAFLPFLLTSVYTFVVAMRRVQEFLLFDEVAVEGTSFHTEGLQTGEIVIEGGERVVRFPSRKHTLNRVGTWCTFMCGAVCLRV